MERVWKFLRPEILRRWDQLTESDLAGCEYQFGLLVEAIRKSHHAGRSPLTFEGEIRDWLDERIEHYERDQNTLRH